MEDYARDFDTLKHWVFDASVKKTFRNGDDTKWCLEVETSGESKTVEFDKVVFCHGYQTKAIVPQFEGQEKFEGVIIHSQQYRRSVVVRPLYVESTRTFRQADISTTSPKPFTGKRVIVLGLSSTAADILPDVLPHALHPVYMSHRRGVVPFRRFRKGVPTDALATWRRRQATHFIQEHFPEFARKLGDLAVDLFIRFSYPNLKPEWRVRPVPSVSLKLPSAVTFDNILPSLEDGNLQSVHSIKRFLGPKKVELLDGMVLDDIDAVILCTGYRADFSVVGGDSVLETSIPSAHGYDKQPGGGSPIYRYVFLYCSHGPGPSFQGGSRTHA